MTFPDHSRVWVYQSSREFTASETEWLQHELSAFAKQWTAHQQQLHAQAEIQYNRFIILMVNQDVNAASGCSIDKSVNFLKEIEKKFDVNLFDRFNLAYRQDGHIHSCSRDEFEKLIQKGIINDTTIVFNNLVATKKELETNWEIPLKDSWHARLFATHSNS